MTPWFSLAVDRPLDESTERVLLERCRDAEVSRPPGGRGAMVSFRRSAPTVTDAVVSAVRDLDAIGVQATGARDEDLVTIAEVAERAGRSPEAVRLWAVGRTGAGPFPAPADVRGGRAYYRWSDVTPWLRQRMGVEVADPEPVLIAVDLALRLRALAPRVSRMEVIRALIAG
jgi:hypothetical protein